MELSDAEKVRKVYPTAYINEDYSGSPSADVGVFRKAIKPKNKEILISGFFPTTEQAWADAASRLPKSKVPNPESEQGEREMCARRCDICGSKEGAITPYNKKLTGVDYAHPKCIASRLSKSEAAPQPDPVQADEYRGHALKAVYRDGIPHLELHPPVSKDTPPGSGENGSSPYGLLCDPTHCDECADQFNKSQISLGVSMPTSEAPDKFAFETHEYRGYKIRAYYLNDGSGNARIELWSAGDKTNEWPVHAYKIWNYSAHLQEIVDSEIAQTQSAELPEPILPPTPSPEGPKEDRGWLPQVLHRASLESLAIRWIQDNASDQDLRDLRDRISKPTAKEIAQAAWTAGRAALSGAARDGDAYALAFNEGVEAGAAAFEYTWQDWIGAAARIRREKLPIIAALSGEKEEK